MTKEEFLSLLKNAGAIVLPVATEREVAAAQMTLQQLRAAMLPAAFTDFYKTVAGGIILGDAHIFGLSDIARGGASPYIMPSVLTVNREISGWAQTAGKTVFGRNGLFWFAFDAFGNCFMLSNLILAPMREYKGDIFKAMSDCLAVGKI